MIRRLAAPAAAAIVLVAAAAGPLPPSAARAGIKEPVSAADGPREPVPAPVEAVPPAPRWGLPSPFPVCAEAADPVFGVLIALAEDDLYGVVTQDRLRAEVARSGRSTRLPLDRLHSIRREPLPRWGGARVILNGYGPVDVRVPYDILGYHPGRFRASPRSVFEEWRLGTVALDIGRWLPAPGERIALFHDVTIWGLESGSVEMDVDGWLDAIMGSKLDDTRVVGFALFRYEGVLYGLATGYSRSGAGRSGAFDFRTDEMVFPSPPAFKAMGSYVRGRLEREIPALVRYRRGG